MVSYTRANDAEYQLDAAPIYFAYGDTLLEKTQVRTLDHLILPS